jgi:hypothetical protein
MPSSLSDFPELERVMAMNWKRIEDEVLANSDPSHRQKVH